MLWTGLALGTFLAVEALTHGVMLPWFGGFADAMLTFVLILAAGVVLADLTRRHHRTVARHGWPPRQARRVCGLQGHPQARRPGSRVRRG